MPIYSLEGTPGAGKTLYSVQKIIPDFMSIRDTSGCLVPRHIYTNIRGFKPWLICAWCGIPYEAISEYFHVLGQAVDEKGNAYEDKDLVRWWMFEPDSIEWMQTTNGARQVERVPNLEKAKRIPNNALVIIDELQNYYSNRDFATTYSKAAIDYITINRHYGWTLVWMSQSVEAVDVNFRRNTEQVWFLERLENYGQKSASSVKKYEGWLAGNKTNMDPFAKDKFKFDKRYFAAYKSYEDGVQGEKRYKTNVFLQSKPLVIMAIIFVVCILYAIFSNPIDTIAGTKKKAPTASPTAQATSAGASRPVSFSGAGEPPSEYHTQSNDTLCAKNSFVQNGVLYVVLNNGTTHKVTGRSKYEVCK